MQTISAVKAAQLLLRETLAAAACVVDATAGNGGDTLYLARFSPPDAVVYAFDIQAAALAATREKTREYARKIRCIQDSHDRAAQYIEGKIDAAMFNLGYLPGGDHALTTRASTTLSALTSLTELLRVNGLIAVVAYPGHAAGREEIAAIETWLTALPVRYFTAGCYAMLNHASEKHAPVLYMIERVRS